MCTNMVLIHILIVFLFSQQYVALKVHISTCYITELAEAEIHTLQQVASRDQLNQTPIVKLLDHFVHRVRYSSHVCMVLEYLGDDLLKLIRSYAPKGLPLPLVKHICLHILDGLDFFHTHFSLLHGDIKPGNICLLSTIDPLNSAASPILPPKQKCNVGEGTSKIAVEACTTSLAQLVLSHDKEETSKIAVKACTTSLAVESRNKELLESLDHRCKLIDFGHACVPGKGNFLSIQTMPYRSPEVILGDVPSFSTSADLWSFACVCFELATGQYLFPAQNGDDYCRDEDHLALMKQHLDRIPPAMIARGLGMRKKWFDNKGRLRNVPTWKRRTIKERLVEDYNFNEKDATELGDFLKWILKYEPTERPTAAKCRRHQWFNDVKDEHFISTSNESGLREKAKLKKVNVVEDEHFISRSKENGPREETKLKDVNVVEDEHFISRSKKSGRREKTKLKDVNVVEDEHVISRSKKSGRREKTKLKDVNVVEDEHFTSRSKGKQISKRATTN